MMNRPLSKRLMSLKDLLVEVYFDIRTDELAKAHGMLIRAAADCTVLAEEIELALEKRSTKEKAVAA